MSDVSLLFFRFSSLSLSLSLFLPFLVVLSGQHFCADFSKNTKLIQQKTKFRYFAFSCMFCPHFLILSSSFLYFVQNSDRNPHLHYPTVCNRTRHILYMFKEKTTYNVWHLYKINLLERMHRLIFLVLVFI